MEPGWLAGLQRWPLLLAQGLGLRASRGELGGESAALALTAWVPLILAALVESLSPVRRPEYLYDLSIHVRFLITVPLLHLGSAIALRLGRETLLRLATEVHGPDPPLGPLALKLETNRRSRPWAVALVVIGALLGQALFWRVFDFPAVDWMRRVGAPTIGWFWYTWVALPIFYVVALRAILFWVLWVASLARVGRLPLRGSAAHPDYRGGFGFTVRPSMAFSLVIAGLSSMLAATWGTEVAFAGVSARLFSKWLVAWALMSLGITLGPLIFLAPRLIETKIRGRKAYEALAASYTAQFDERWLRSAPELPLLGAPDIQSLADLGGAFQVVRTMKIVPFGVENVMLVLLASVGPVLPLALTEVPFMEVLKGLFHILLR